MCWFSETWGGAQVFFIVSCFYGIIMLSGHFLNCPPLKIDSTSILARQGSQCRGLCHFDNWLLGVAFCQNPEHDDLSWNQPHRENILHCDPLPDRWHSIWAVFYRCHTGRNRSGRNCQTILRLAQGDWKRSLNRLILDQFKPPHHMTHLNFASQHGSMIPRQGLELCEDDNTFTPYTFHVHAWACLLSDGPKADPEPANPTPYHTWEELLAAMYDWLTGTQNGHWISDALHWISQTNHHTKPWNSSNSKQILLWLQIIKGESIYFRMKH